MGAYRQALQQLRPTSKISFSGPESYETLQWKDPAVEPPTKEEVEALASQLAPAWDQWMEARKAAYPTVEEQLDMLWHMMDSGEYLLKGNRWYEVVRQAKLATPKPE